ncbi:MAG: aminotransferase class V-fold PLP-dependent enzyme [Pseudomonadota bacterium]
MTTPSRRRFLSRLGTLGLAATLPAGQAARPLALPSSAKSATDLASDEGWWRAVARLYDRTDEIVNLENGYWGMMARPVLDAFIRNTKRVNRDSSWYARREFNTDAAAVMARLATAFGTSSEEVVLTRNATEALQVLITGYNGLRPGDTVLYADIDYPAMQTAMASLEARRGVRAVKIDMPEPATYQTVIDAYERALAAHPKTRLVLLTHLTHRTGLMTPVAELTRLAKARGAEVIVDAAHSWGQVPFDAPDLGADFIGFNLHKWLGAPMGLGMMYVRRDRTRDIDNFLGEPNYPTDDIRGKVNLGTYNYPALLTVPTAIDVHEAIGVDRKAARLRWLRNRWVGAVHDVPGIEVLVPDDERMHGGLTAFRLSGKTSREENVALVKRLADEFGIFTTHRTGLASGACVRVTPALFTAAEDVDRLAGALKIVGAR